MILYEIVFSQMVDESKGVIRKVGDSGGGLYVLGESSYMNS